ncbi:MULTISPECIES: helix-turn-helix domain-containing protein [Bacillales]|uniref:helix-turn-helix domain-containing protein n=1 Tax=Bacillales TaxID=1385 RepID=UPI000F983A8E|nr:MULTISPECIES: helix-turn-helix domain-containing protein [Bacillus]MBB4876445.1 excisionase family DNA binding protein [Bacillus velezensis]MBE1281669.1 helix-turn-helix domain-containing protein [Bacillus sp. Bvel1]MCM3278793.1 helix-turn-helix domain-containing protein [Bacillus velezensis]MCM3351872.1 helix-turn-helix domain-containing protein [Bacillus velezensis]MDQ9149963.1 helix-turn-helix domain-containing protein [Bacillus velezensis]
MTEEKSYTVREVSGILNVSDKTVRKLLNDGDLKGFKVGKNWRVKPSEVEKYQNQN